MKKIILLVVSMIVSIGVIEARDKTIKLSELPKNAQTFVSTHLNKAEVSYVSQDLEPGDREYKVVFTNGTKVEFDKNGNWKDVECKSSAVPASIIPSKIQAHINSAFPNTKIIKIEKDRPGYDIDLSNGVELKFGAKGNFIREDR